MAKQFLANRSGQTPTLDEVPNETIKIYPTEADLDADLANLEENEIVATDEDNNPASGTQYPVDIVQEGNMSAVTSNAVAEYCKGELIWDGSNWTPSGGSVEKLYFTHEIDEKSILLLEVKPYNGSGTDELVTFTFPLKEIIDGKEFRFTGKRIIGSSGSYTWIDWGIKISVATTTYIERGNGISQQYNDGNWGLPYRIWVIR